MKRYQLAKIVDWAGKLDTRKRIQKMVYLLQAAGCPLDADFFLHRYGPYSPDVAQLTDNLVSLNVLREMETPNQRGSQFAYELTDFGKEQLKANEGRADVQCLRDEMSVFESRAKTLLEASLRKLEVASTIAYYRKNGQEWSDARQLACEFKDVDPKSKFAIETEEFARTIVE